MRRIFLSILLLGPTISTAADEGIKNAVMKILPEARVVVSEKDSLIPKFNLPPQFDVNVFVERLKTEFGAGVMLVDPAEIHTFPFPGISQKFDYFKIVVNGKNVIGTISRITKESEFLVTFVTVTPEVDTNMKLPTSD
jgi:hypothetical protein